MPRQNRLSLVPDLDARLSLRWFHFTAPDGTALQGWSNDVTGAKSGPTVVLCNGLGTNPYAWPSLLDPACPVRVVSWNHRGTGGSSRPTDPERVGIDAFAEDAVALMDHVGVDAAVMMGWSMGVNTMYEVAVEHPDRVLGLYAVGGVPGGTFESMMAPLFLPRPLRKPILAGTARLCRRVGHLATPTTTHLPIGDRFIRVLSHSGFMLPLADPEIGQRAVQEFFSTPVEWYAHLALHASYHRRVSLRSVRVPTAFVAGTYDVLASAHDMRTAADRIPGATYTELRASHFLPLEKPAEVHAGLLALLDRVESAAESA